MHTTIGVYLDGSFKINGVDPADLLAHISFNQEHRPGRALFVDGKCKLTGNLTTMDIRLFEDRIKDNPEFIAKKIKKPYI